MNVLCSASIPRHLTDFFYDLIILLKSNAQAGTSGASKTATGMAHFSIMWQGPPTMADEAFPGG